MRGILFSKSGARRGRLFLAAAGVFTFTAAAQARPDILPSSAEKLRFGIDGVTRSFRALYTIGFVVTDYKYSLRGCDLKSIEYHSKLSEVHLRSARRILKLCEVNKGFYVKAGQFASSLRQIPKEYSSTLSSLQDQAVPCKFKDIKEVLLKNLQKDLSEIFLSFDEEPIAAASIAQVHHALLKDNREVAVKVQYPGLKQQMKVDITTMALLSKLVRWIFPSYRFERVVSEFEKAMLLELDFIQEGNNSERTARNFRSNNIIRVPHVFWELSTDQVLTMQFCSGYKIDNLEFYKQSGVNPIKVAKALLELFAEMVFVHGFLHGDPHPGNILVSPEGAGKFTLVILDHGIYKELDSKFRTDYCRLWKALILLDSSEILHIAENFGVGKYARYFPVIFTGRMMNRSALGAQMSTEEKKALKEELRSLNVDDISTFMESLPPDFLAVLRTDGLLRSILSKLGAPRRIRLLIYAKYAAYGLTLEERMQSDRKFRYAIQSIKMTTSYLQLRVVLDILDLITRLEELRRSFVDEMKWWLLGIIQFINKQLYTLKV